MRSELMVRKEIPKIFKQIMPYSTVFESGRGIGGESSYDFEVIPIIREIIEFTRDYSYQVRLEYYRQHRVLDVVIEYDDVSNYYVNNFVITYDLISKKIIGYHNGDKEEDTFFTSFIMSLIEKFIDPIRKEIDKEEVLDENK